ncbi:MAG: PEP-CTERM sorting domain-containing protein [Pseudomonadota bacterium]
MNTLTCFNKKMLVAATILAAGGLLVNGTASAVPCSTLATTNDWQGAGSCTDTDGDMLFTFGAYSGSFPGDTGFHVHEVELSGKDFYDVHFHWETTPYVGGGDIKYTMTSLTPTELISSAAFDTDVVGQTLATKELFDIGSLTPFLTLTSASGSHDPVGGGHYDFAPRASLYVVDTFNATGTAGVFNSASNSFNVPEPTTMLLLGGGLMGMAFATRQRTASKA